MERSSRWIAAAAVPVLAVAALVVGGGRFPPQAHAGVAATPVFGAPTVFTNPFFTFVPSGSRISTGKADGTASVILDSFLAETRDFPWNGGTVTCRILVETNFEGGKLIENTRNHFAQADDGSVWYFGETVDTYESGVVTGHEGSWLVGGGTGGDPPGTIDAPGPGYFMPAAPVAGVQFHPEDVPAGPQEVDTVRRVGRTVRVPGGTFAGCIEVQEHDLVDDDYETKWYAPGVGVIKGKTQGETFALIATSLPGAQGE